MVLCWCGVGGVFWGNFVRFLMCVVSFCRVLYFYGFFLCIVFLGCFLI